MCFLNSIHPARNVKVVQRRDEQETTLQKQNLNIEEIIYKYCVDKTSKITIDRQQAYNDRYIKKMSVYRVKVTFYRIRCCVRDSRFIAKCNLT